MHCGQDRFHHAVDVRQHLVVPEAQDAITLSSEIYRSLCISDNIFRLIVLRSIDLDDKAPFMAGEISEVGADRRLPPEV